MLLHAWLSLWLVALGACSALTVGARRFKDSDVVSTKALIDPRSYGRYERQGLSRRALQASHSPGTDPLASQDGVHEARSSLSGIPNLEHDVHNALTSISRVNRATGNVDKSLRFKTRLQLAFKDRYEPGSRRNTAHNLYRLLKKTKSNKEIVAQLLELRERKNTQEFAGEMLTYLINDPGTKTAMFDTLLQLEQTPYHVFPLMCTRGMDLKVEPFREWIKYAGLYRQYHSSVHKHNFVQNQRFLYLVIDTIKHEKGRGNLVNLFEYARKRSDIAKLGGELKLIAKQEKAIAAALNKPTPLTPEEFATSMDLVVSTNGKFIMWLRYCMLYSLQVGEKNGKEMLLENSCQMVFDVMLTRTTIDRFVPLFQSVREIPGLEFFADSLVKAAERELQIRQWLGPLRLPDAVYHALPTNNNRLQLFRFLKLYENEFGSTISLRDVLSIMFEPKVPYTLVDAIKIFEDLKKYVDVRPIVSRLQTEAYDHQAYLQYLLDAGRGFRD